MQDEEAKNWSWVGGSGQKPAARVFYGSKEAGRKLATSDDDDGLRD
jgi:hypothetical protein